MSEAAFTNFLTAKGYGPTLRDWQHASRLYIDGGAVRSPKVGFLYFVELHINETVSSKIGPAWTANDMKDVGILVKKSDLPKFTIANETINQYNRKTVVPTKITYNPVSVEFHDDNSDITHNLWVNYYKNYFDDGNQGALAFLDTKYKLNDISYGRYDNKTSNNFFREINIYVLHQKKFTQYTLVNPKISEWQHDSVDQSQGNKIMQNRMTISYESVIYQAGVVSENFAQASGWSLSYYDKETSPYTVAGQDNQDILYNRPGSSTVVNYAQQGTLDDQAAADLAAVGLAAGGGPSNQGLSANDQPGSSRVFNNLPSNRSSIFDHQVNKFIGSPPISKVTNFDQAGNQTTYSNISNPTTNFDEFTNQTNYSTSYKNGVETISQLGNNTPTKFDQFGNRSNYSTVNNPPTQFNNVTANLNYGAFRPPVSVGAQLGHELLYPNVNNPNRPAVPGILQQIGTTLFKNYVNQNGLTRQKSVGYNIAGSVMGQIGSGPGKYASPPSTEDQLGVFTLPGGVGINIFKGFNTTVDGSIRANPAAILFPRRG